MDCVLWSAFRQYDRKLLSTDPRCHIHVSKGLFQALCQGFEGHVTGIVPVIVVDIFEMVHIDQNESAVSAGSGAAVNLPGHGRMKKRGIHKTRQSIVHRQITEGINQRLQLYVEIVAKLCGIRDSRLLEDADGGGQLWLLDAR